MFKHKTQFRDINDVPGCAINLYTWIRYGLIRGSKHFFPYPLPILEDICTYKCNSIFKYYSALKSKFEIFTNPMTVSIQILMFECNRAICEQTVGVNQKVNLFTKTFWKLQKKFPTWRNMSLEIVSLFGSAYILN